MRKSTKPTRGMIAFRRPFVMAIASGALVLSWSAVGLAAPADRPSEVRMPAVQLPAKTAAAGAVALARVLPRGGTFAMPALETLANRRQWGVLTDLVRLFTDNKMELASGNRDNSLLLKPLADNEVELLSGNETKLLSDNQPKLFSENRPALFNGNTIKIFSDVNILSGINVNVNVRIEKSGNKGMNADRDNDMKSAFERLDLDGDGRISAEEFRAGLAD